MILKTHQSNGTEPARSCVIHPEMDPGLPDVTDNPAYHFYLVIFFNENSCTVNCEQFVRLSNDSSDPFFKYFSDHSYE